MINNNIVLTSSVFLKSSLPWGISGGWSDGHLKQSVNTIIHLNAYNRKHEERWFP